MFGNLRRKMSIRNLVLVNLFILIVAVDNSSDENSDTTKDSLAVNTNSPETEITDNSGNEQDIDEITDNVKYMQQIDIIENENEKIRDIITNTDLHNTRINKLNANDAYKSISKDDTSKFKQMSTNGEEDAYTMSSPQRTADVATNILSNNSVTDDDNIPENNTPQFPNWFKQGRFGIFFNWQLYSVYGIGDQGYGRSTWTLKDSNILKTIKPNFTYAELVTDFSDDLYEPDELINLAKDAQAKYVVMTSKYAEGFPLWNSNYSNLWNSVVTPPKTDLLGEFVKAAIKNNMRYGLSYSFGEKTYNDNTRNLWQSNIFTIAHKINEMHDLLNRFKPDLFWVDNPSEIPGKHFYKDVLEWIGQNHNSTVVSTELETDITFSVYRKIQDLPYSAQSIPFEFRSSMDKKSTENRKDAVLNDFKTVAEILTELVWTVSVGGNYVISVPVTEYGRVPPLCEERLREVGQWIQMNHDAVYSSIPYKLQKDIHIHVCLLCDLLPKNKHFTHWNRLALTGNNMTRQRYTEHMSKKQSFVFVMEWPQNNLLRLSFNPHNVKKISMFGYEHKLNWMRTGNNTIVKMPKFSMAEIPSFDAWVLKIVHFN